MQSEHDLTTKVLAFQRGELDAHTAIALVAEEIFRFLNRHFGAYQEMQADFLSDHYLQIITIIQRFKYQGIPFEHYLNKTLRWRWIGYTEAQSRHKRLKSILTYNSGENIENLADPACLHGVPERAEAHKQASSEVWENFLSCEAHLPRNRSTRMLIGLLCEADSIEVTQIEEFCERTGYDFAWVESLVNKLRDCCAAKRVALEKLYDHRAETYVAAWVADHEASRVVSGEIREHWKKKAQMLRARADSMLVRIRVLRLGVTHREIGEVLGISKGTIDSSLHYLKRQLTVVYNAAHANTSGDQQSSQKG